MDLLDYTTCDEIRACFGVNDVEISDATLALPMYSSDLSIELDEVSLDLQTAYETVKAIAANSRTRVQERFMETVTLFATYTVAKQCCVSLPMFGPKSVSDSKTEVSRFNDSPYKQTIKSIKEKWEIYRQRTLAALAGLDSSEVSTVQRVVMVVSTPTYDPVTG